MISYKNENGNVKELTAQGSMKDLLAESAYLLTAIYSMLARRDKAAAEIFKVSMMMAMGDPESPVWQDLKPDCLSIIERRKKEETHEEVKVDASVDGMIGPLVDLTNMKPKLLDMILNGPTLNGVSKDTLRSIIRQLYSALAACEDTGLEPEEVDKLTKDWSDLCTVLGECGGIDALRELAEANKNGRLAVLPRKTRQTELLKMFPEAHVSANGSLYLCPASVSAAYRDENGNCKVRRIKCADCRKEFWGQEVE